MPEALWFTDDEEANRLLAEDPFALLVGFALDQQVTVQQAFLGPLRLKQRLGTLEPRAVASLPIDRVLCARARPPTSFGGGRRYQPMLPTISSSMSRLSSTAYSRGSSFVIGSMKPFTRTPPTSAAASPRCPASAR